MDFIVFGRSEKFRNTDDYSFRMHKATLKAFIEGLDLNGITLVVQDWGGLIGLTVATEIQERIARLFIMNTGLPIGVNLPGHSPGLLKQFQLSWRFLFFIVIFNIIPYHFRCHLVP
jgi:pimeloyl-ACP methyl ester carboxylesterase